MNNELLLGRQPVLDQHQKLVGYELMLQLEAGDKTPPTYNPSRAAMLICAASVSYTHLDVYKRQTMDSFSAT